MPPILRQKLTPPRPWAGVIARPRLESWLDAAFERGAHVGVFAGTGYGKTALLAAWARRRQAAWVTLDAEDADLDVALAYLIAAFESAVPGFKTEARDLLGRAREREGAFATLSALLADLDEQVDRPLALVIDDYHLAASPSLDALVSRMLRYLPPTIRLVLSTRKPPDVELAMLQARGTLEVLDERGLAFDAAELAELRPGTAPQALLDATGGWPAAMGLTPELLDAFLEEQLLASLPADVRAFLQRVAVVEAFDAALCEEALDAPFTRERRDYLVRERLVFNRGAERYALQPAVRNLLARRFQAEVPHEARQTLLRRVGDHFWRAGQAATALRYWAEAGEPEVAADRLLEVADAWLAAGRLDALANAIAQLGPAAGRPAIQLYRAELHRRWGDFSQAEMCFEQALAGPPAIATRARVGQAQIAGARGNVAAARACLAQLGPVSGPLALDLAILEGGLALLSGETDRAIGAYEGALALARRLQDPFGEARATHNLGICYIRTGEFDRALACYDRAIAATAADGTPLVWMAPINRALVLVHLGEPAAAAAAAEAALELVRRYGLTREEGYALRILGFAKLRKGARDAAAASFLAAEHLARRANDTLGLAYSLNFRVELALAGGNPEAARGLAEEVERAMGGRDAAAGILDFAQTRAKVALALGQRDDAHQLVAALLAKARSLGYVQLAKELEAMDAGAPTPAPAPAAATPDEPAPALTVRCLGVFRASRAGHVITDREWQTARAKQLFAFLLFTPEGATKERLLETVFPGEEVSNDLMNMSLMRLRKALEPDLEKGRPSRFILRADGRYLFNRQAHVAVDADSFEAALRAARPEDGPGEAEALERALALYQGEFMPELDAPWVVAMRLRLQEAALGVCRRLVALYDELRPAEATRVLRRALELDPASEEFNREVILRHLEAGELHLARAQYQLCERHYKEVLGTAPPEDLAGLVGEPKR